MQERVARAARTFRLLEERFDPAGAGPLLKEILQAARQEAGQTEDLEMVLKGLQTRFERGVLGQAGQAEWLAPLMVLAFLAGMHDTQAEAEAEVAATEIVAAEQPRIEWGFFAKPEEAIEWFREKQVLPMEQFKALDAAAKARAFSVARLSDLAALEELKASIQKAIEGGQTANAWLDGLEARLRSAGLGDLAADSSYWRLVLRQNESLALSAGRYIQQRQVVDARPYWMNVSIIDEGTTDECRALDGVIKPADDTEFWGLHYPPTHFQCRRVVVTLSAEEMEAQGLAVDPRGPGDFPPPQPGFAHNPAAAFFLNKGPAGMETTKEGSEALEALSEKPRQTEETGAAILKRFTARLSAIEEKAKAEARAQEELMRRSVGLAKERIDLKGRLDAEGNPARRAAMEARWQAVKAEQARVHQKLSQKPETAAAKEKLAEQVKEACYAPAPARRLHIPLTEKAQAHYDRGTHFKEAVDEGSDFVRKMVGSIGDGRHWSVTTTAKRRAFATKGEAAFSPPWTSRRTVVHEFGHVLEKDNRDIRRAAQEFLLKRAEGEKLVRLSSATGVRGYGSDELTYRDKFIDPYMGKHYTSGDTEIISMGLEQVCTDPLEFMRRDPEYFTWLLDTLREARRARA